MVRLVVALASAIVLGLFAAGWAASNDAGAVTCCNSSDGR